jgi:hypothetical protein
LTVSELQALYKHRQKEVARRRENAAFAGYCAGAAFALAWTGKLGDFRDFYHVPEKESCPVPTTEDHIKMMRERGEGGPP